MYTEEEAKTKQWCPHKRIGKYELGASVNTPDQNNNCIASECMSWRWMIHQPGYTNEADRGYCGLAGEP